MKNAFQSMESLSLEEMQTYAKSQYVKDFTYTLTTSLNAGEGLEAVDTSGSSDSGGNAQAQQPPNLPDGGKGGRFPLEGMGTQGDFTLVGYSSHSAMTAFVAGTCQVTDGEVFDEAAAEPVCLISDELATLNGLQVGDTLALVNPNDETETVTLTIAGLYHNSAAGAEQGGMMKGFSAASDPANQIYLSYPALKAITDASAAAAVTSTDEETGEETVTVTWAASGEDVTGNADTASLLAELGALTFTKCVDYKPTDEAAALCGFDAPQATVTILYLNDTGTEGTLTLTFGSENLDQTGYYVRMEGDSTIYQMDTASVDTILSVAENGLTAADATGE